MPRLVEIDIQHARKMRDEGASWEEVGNFFHTTAETAHRKLDSAYDAKRKRQIGYARRTDCGDKPEVGVALIEPDTRTWQQRLLGDPDYRRSSLYAKRHGQ